MITHFEFSKEIHPRYAVEGFGILKNWKVYKVAQAEKHIGQFYYHDEICFFEYEDKEMGLKISRPVFQNIQASIVDRKTERRVGAIEIPTIHRTFDATIGWMQLSDVIYKGEKQEPEKGRSIWSENWGYYQFCISNTQQDVIYGLQTSRFATSPFKNGRIQLLGNDLLLLFAGFFLLEKALQKEAREATG
ncbi:MAG TPA: hypothetical protein VIM64_20905 [Puia sp.]